LTNAHTVKKQDNKLGHDKVEANKTVKEESLYSSKLRFFGNARKVFFGFWLLLNRRLSKKSSD
jgi:hypothetical protein